MKLWIVAAGKGEAYLLSGHSGRPGRYQVVERFDNPIARTREHLLGTDRPGRVYGSRGTPKHALTREQSISQHIAKKFALRIARYLDGRKGDGSFEGLVFFSAPEFLGILKGSVSRALRKRIAQAEPYEWHYLTERELFRKVGENIEIPFEFERKVSFPKLRARVDHRKLSCKLNHDSRLRDGARAKKAG